MSLNKLTTLEEGKKINLNIGANTMECINMICDNHTINGTGDFKNLDSENITAETSLNLVTGDGKTLNLTTPDLGADTYSLHTDGLGNCYWDPDDTGSSDLTFNGTTPVSLGQFVKFTNTNAKTVEESKLVEGVTDLDLGTLNITNAGTLNGEDINTLASSVSTNGTNIGLLQTEKINRDGTIPMTGNLDLGTNNITNVTTTTSTNVETSSVYNTGTVTYFRLGGNSFGDTKVTISTAQGLLLNTVNLDCGNNNITDCNQLNADTIVETTLNNGVTIETVSIKDGLVDGVDVSALNTTVGTNSSTIGTLSTDKADKDGTSDLKITKATPEIELKCSVSTGGCAGSLQFTDSLDADIASISAPSGDLELKVGGSTKLTVKSTRTDIAEDIFVTGSTPTITLIDNDGAGVAATGKVQFADSGGNVLADVGLASSEMLFRIAEVNKVLLNSTSFVPDLSGQIDLGVSAQRFNDLYLTSNAVCNTTGSLIFKNDGVAQVASVGISSGDIEMKCTGDILFSPSETNELKIDSTAIFPTTDYGLNLGKINTNRFGQIHARDLFLADATPSILLTDSDGTGAAATGNIYFYDQLSSELARIALEDSKLKFIIAGGSSVMDVTSAGVEFQNGLLTIQETSTGDTPPKITFKKKDSVSGVTANDLLGRLTFFGNKTTGEPIYEGAYIDVKATDTAGLFSIPSEIKFFASSDKDASATNSLNVSGTGIEVPGFITNGDGILPTSIDGGIHISGVAANNNNQLSFIINDAKENPCLQLLGYNHDIVAISFDSYWNGSTYLATHAGSQFQLKKDSNGFAIRYGTEPAIGDTVAWTDGLLVDTSGDLTVTGDIIANSGFTLGNINDGSSYFISLSDANWGFYLARSSDGKSMAGGTPSTLDGITNYASRSRAFNSAGYGFIWENSSETALMSLTSDTGDLTLTGNLTLQDNIIMSGNDITGCPTISNSSTIAISPNSSAGGDLIFSSSLSGGASQRILDFPADTNVSRFYTRVLGNATSASQYYECRWTTNVTGVRLFNTVAASGWSTFSDRKRKKNIKETTENCCEKLAKIQIYDYHFKQEDSKQKKSRGVIAQEIKNEFPNFVHGEEYVEGDEDTGLCVTYTNFIPYLIKAVQELSAQNALLTARIEALESP